MKIENFKTANHIIPECPSCKNKHILYDEHHDQIFCKECGLVILEQLKNHPLKKI